MSENKLKISRQNTFSFKGFASVTDKTFTINSTNTKGDWVHNALNLAIDCGESGINYVNAIGGYGPNRDNKIYLQKVDSDGKFLSGENSTQIVSWDDRFDLTAEELSLVSYNSLVHVSLEKDENGNNVRKQFLSMYDAIAYIKDHLNDKDPIEVRGHLEYRPSPDGSEWYTQHVLDSITLKNPEYLNPIASVDLMVLVGKKAMGKPNFEERNIPFFFNTLTYVRTVDGNKYNQTCVVPVKVLLDMNGGYFDATTEFGQKNIKYCVENFFEPSEEGRVDELLINCTYSGGVKKVEVTLNDLPKEIREAVEHGMMREEDVLGAMAISGSAPKELIFVQVPVYSTKVKDEKGNESQNVNMTQNKAKYADEDLITFEELEPIENVTKTTAPVDNTLELDEDEGNSLDSILSMFAGLDK